MIRHIALFTFTDEATDDQVRAMQAALSDLPPVIDEIKRYTIGRDLGLGGDNYDFAVIGDFESPDAYRRYAAHPRHVDVLTTHVKPVMEDVVRIQFEVS